MEACWWRLQITKRISLVVSSYADTFPSIISQFVADSSRPWHLKLKLRQWLEAASGKRESLIVIRVNSRIKENILLSTSQSLILCFSVFPSVMIILTSQKSDLETRGHCSNEIGAGKLSKPFLLEVKPKLSTTEMLIIHQCRGKLWVHNSKYGNPKFCDENCDGWINSVGSLANSRKPAWLSWLCVFLAAPVFCIFFYLFTLSPRF